MEKYRERLKDLHMAFLDLEKAYDCVPRELIWKTLVDKGTSRRYIKVIRDIYDGAKTRVRTLIRNTKFFPVDVGLHQGSAISLYLFALILKELPREIQEDIPCNEEIANNEELDVCIGDKILQPKESFWYLGSMLHKSRRVEEDVSNLIKAAWMKPQSALVRRVKALVVDGLRRRGRPKLRWEDRVKHDMKELLLSEDMTSDKNEWRAKIRIDTNGIIKVLPPKTAEEVVARERERKARTTLLMALPEDHLAKFHKMTDEKEMWEAIKSRFYGNDESKKMHKYLLKQQFKDFSMSTSEGLHKGYDRFQTLLSQLEIHGAGVSHEDVNQEFLRSLSSSWSQVTLIMRTKPGLDTFSFDDLYNNLRVFECDVKGTTASSSNTQNKEGSSSYTDEVIHSFFTNQSSALQLDYDDLEQINDDDIEEIDLKWQVAMISMRIKKFHKRTGRKAKGNQDSKRRDAGYNGNKTRDNYRIPLYQDDLKALVTIDGEDIDWSVHVEEDAQNYAMMAYFSSNLDSKHSEYASFESDSSVESPTSMLEPVENASKVVCEPKVWTDAPIIEEYESDSDNDSVSNDDPHRALKDKRIVDNGCSRHMTGNKAHLADYQEFKGGSVAFGGSNGRITVYDKKNKVLFTDTDCLVLSLDFKLPDENQVLLKITRQHNMYSFNLKNINPSRYLACLFAKASMDESNKWHRRLGHVNFKNLNKLVKGNLVRGLPFKTFENDHTCVACQKRKQHKASLENQANKSAGSKEPNNSVGTQANDDQGANSEEIDLNEEHFVLHIWSAYSTTINSLGEKIEQNTGFKTCEKPNASTISTNLINTASTPLSTTGPSRAFNDGELSYPDPFKYALPDYPSMPHLEDIYASPSKRIFTDSSYDDEGVVTDFNSLETTVSVSSTPTIRIHTIHPKTQILRDPKSGVQTRSKVNKNSEAHALISQALEDESWVDAMNKKDERGVVVRNKARLVAQGHRQEEGIDYDEVFALVARIEAIRIFLAFASYMGFIFYQMDVKSAFMYGTNDKEVYVSQPPGFVDPKFPNKVYKVMKALYGLHQAPRACVKTASTPIETQKPLVKDEEATDVDVYLYRSMIGSLMYLTAFRPDIMFAVCAYFRFQVTPKTLHLHAVKRIFRDAYEKKLIQVLKIHTDDNVVDLLNKAFNVSSKELASLKQTALGKDISNPLMAGRLPKTTLPTRVNIKESSIRRTLKLDDAKGTSCLANAEIFDGLAKMGYEKLSEKLTFYKAFFSPQWKFLIHTILQCLSAKTTSWNKFSSTMASAIICLVINQKFNFSRYILLSLVKNIKADVPFFMFLRFVQLLIDHQLGDMSHHKDIYDNLSLTKKVFTNIKRVGIGFSGVVTSLFDNMLVPAAREVGLIQDDVQLISISTEPSTSKSHKKHKPKKQQTQAPKVPSLEPSPEHGFPLPSNDPFPSGKDSLKLKELMDLCAHLSNKVLELKSEVIDIKSTYQERIKKLEGRVDRLEEENRVLKELHNVHSKVDTAAPIVEEEKSFKQGRIIAYIDEDDVDDQEPAEVEEVLEVVTGAKLITEVVTTAGATTTAEATKVSVPRRRKGVVIQDPEKTTSTVVVHSEVQSKDKGKVMKYQALKRKPLTEAQARKNMIIYLKNMAGYKMNYFKGMTYSEITPHFEKHYNYNQAFLEEVNKEVTVPKKEVEVNSHKREEATPLASKIYIVYYKIHLERNKPYFKIIRVDCNHMLFLSFSTSLKNFDKEDLESLWKLVKERFEKTEPKNYTDDYLLKTIKTMFEQLDVKASV
nr:hypothetical protein [Tanacetum cinerariifolium]